MKNKIILLVIIFSLILVGCGHKKPSTKKITSIKDVNNKSGSLTCTRKATASDGVVPSFEYHIKYNNDNILVIHSIEKITSTNEESLNQYENAYKKINSYYKNLKYYDSEVIRNDNSVTRDTTINYKKMDIDALIAIEGEEDNIIKNGKASLNMWLDFAGKFGTTCHED